MKKLLSAALFIGVMSVACGCGNNNGLGSGTGTNKVDLDLTRLNSTMIYSEVYNIMAAPEEYIGKKIKMNGNLNVYESPETNKTYYACLITDATACCAQGIEFAWRGEHSPEDYPTQNTNITVTGTFDQYKEDGQIYYHLTDAQLTF